MSCFPMVLLYATCHNAPTWHPVQDWHCQQSDWKIWKQQIKNKLQFLFYLFIAGSFFVVFFGGGGPFSYIWVCWVAPLEPAPVPFIPPEKPRQLAKMMSGSSSRPKSLMACAVLYAESGNHTWPACWITCITHKKDFARLLLLMLVH